MSRLRFAALTAFALAMSLAWADAAELVMFERAGCAWCAHWNRDVAPIYPRTSEGRAAPLRRVDLDAAPPTDLVLTLPVRFTPTFVVVENGREVGRITGYVNDDWFWGLLSGLLARIPDGGARAEACTERECP